MINTKEWPEPLVKVYWNFLLEKQHQLLESRLIQAQHTLDDVLETQANTEVYKDIIERELEMSIAKLIGQIIPTEQRKKATSNTHQSDQTIYSKRCLVLNLGELKHIVDLLVKTIPIEELARIRNTDLATLEQQLSQLKFKKDDTV